MGINVSRPIPNKDLMLYLINPKLPYGKDGERPHVIFTHIEGYYYNRDGIAKVPLFLFKVAIARESGKAPRTLGKKFQQSGLAPVDWFISNAETIRYLREYVQRYFTYDEQEKARTMIAGDGDKTIQKIMTKIQKKGMRGYDIALPEKEFLKKPEPQYRHSGDSNISTGDTSEINVDELTLANIGPYLPEVSPEDEDFYKEINFPPPRN